MPTKKNIDKAPRSYSVRTVIAAHRRVLDMAASYLEQMPQRVLDTAVVDRCTGLTTGDDVLHHILEAKKLRYHR